MKNIIMGIIRVITGYVLLVQGYEKVTGNFKIEGLVEVIKNNQDTPNWYKLFFKYVVDPYASLFNILVPLGELIIGITLIMGILTYVASLMGIFVMLNYILADMIYIYPIILGCLILIALNINSAKHYNFESFMGILKKLLKRT